MPHRSRLPLALLACLFLTDLPLAAADLPPVEIVLDTPPDLPSVSRVTPITRGPKHHFVGYYGITPFDAADRRLFCLEADAGDRLINADDRATVCLIDPVTSALQKIAETNTWNLQQGAMLHWLPTAP